MTWLLELHPLLIIATALVLAGLFVAGWIQTGRMQLLLGVIPVVLAAAALLVAGHWIVTPREQVEASLRAAAAAFEAGDAAAVVAHIHPDNTALRSLVQQELPNWNFHEVDIKRNLEIILYPEEGEPEEAVVKFNVVAEISGRREMTQPRRYPRYVEATLERVDDRWLLVEVEHFEPLRGMRNDPGDGSTRVFP